jgi:hypothetical protein
VDEVREMLLLSKRDVYEIIQSEYFKEFWSAGATGS